MRKYKYIHIFWHADTKFNPEIAKMVNENNTLFDPNDHYFVTPHLKTYEAIKMYPNVELVKDGNLINR